VSSKLVFVLLLEGSAFLQHLLYGALQLTVATGEVILGRVVNHDIGIKLGVLAVVATNIYTTYLWDTEYDIVDKCLPPYAGRSTGYRSTDKLTYLHILILTRESTGITVVVLAEQNA
jgi:hypothetical protein